MNKTFKISANTYLILNGISILLLILGHTIADNTLSITLTTVFGILTLFIFVPNNILTTGKYIIDKYTKGKFSTSFPTNYFLYLTIYFFLFVPIIYLLNLIIPKYQFELTANNLIIIVILIYLSSLYFYKKNTGLIYSIKVNKGNVKNFISNQWPLLTVFMLFMLTHIINYSFYKFMPESDGYVDLIKINNIIKYKYIYNNYRVFFATSAAVLSILTKISPYKVFTVIFIILQSTIIFSTYGFIKIANNKYNKTFLTFLILLGTISIPVLNMEIDYVRPQSILVMFLPIYIFFVYKLITTNKNKEKLIFFLIATTLISVLGLNYHQLFSILLLNQGFIFILLLKNNANRIRKYKYTTLTKILIIIILFESLIIFLPRLDSITHLIRGAVRGDTSNIFNAQNWRLWFLSNYQTTHGKPMGWPGLSGGLKYYGYYISPIIAIYVLTFLYLLIKKGKNFLKDNKNILLSVTVMITILFLYAEIFPRLGYIYLPERGWIFIDIMILSISPFLIFTLYKFTKYKNLLIGVLLISSLLGIIGSFYIAYNKTVLITPQEYKSVTWIKENTPNDAIFITQPANAPLLRYFAKRNIVIPPSDFFTNENVDNNVLNKIVINKEMYKLTNNRYKNFLNQPIKNFYIPGKDDFICGGSIDQNKINNEIEKYCTEINTYRFSHIPKDNIYILYSTNKFGGLYKEREWWLKDNFYDANINKLSEQFQLLYDKEGIFIWRYR